MEDLVNKLIPLTYLGFIVLEKLFPARSFPTVRFWRLKGFLFFVLGGALTGALPGLWIPLARQYRVIDLESLPLPAAVALGLLALEFFGYWWHRARHTSTGLWRMHQLHHASERLDVASAFNFHPLDTLAFALLSSLTMNFVLGLSADAAALAGYIGFALTIFTHLNVKTPSWLGYLIQRPEQHAVHHERGAHAFNYGLFSISDLMFGTFRNPKTFDAQVGFWDGASKKLGKLLALRDVTEPSA